MMKVIDLSKFNTVDDFAKVKEAVDAVILRLGYRGAHTGTITYDPKYLEYMSACQKHGIPTMIYFFPCSISTAEADAEANFIISAAKKVKLAGPIWIDSEVVYQDRSGRSDKLGKADRTKYLNVILRRLHEAGYECGVYASKSWFAGNLNDADLEPYCLRWVAQWADQLTYTGHDVAMWQYTNNGSIPGINGRVDISRCYIALDGSKGPEAVQTAVTRTDIVQQVCSWEGWNEKTEKHRIIIDIYNKYLPTAVKSGTLNYTVKYIDEWCATGASGAYIQAGAPEFFPIECGCPRMITLAKKMGIWQEADNYVPKLAEAVLYDWEDSGSGDNQGTADHIGIVIDVDEKAGTFTVMECNKDEAVGRRVMRINGRYIRGFICPKFAKDTNVPTKIIETKVAKTAGGYEISGTGTPSKKVLFTGILKLTKKVTARRRPKVSGELCSFSPVDGLTWIDVCDYITTDKKWAYCCINGLYGYVLNSSIIDYVRKGGQSIDKVVQWVLDNDFGTLETRRKCLESLGYDYDAVQEKANVILKGGLTSYRVCLEESHKAATIREAGRYDVLAVDACYTAEDVEQIHAAGCRTALCYVNYGMAEKSWKDFRKYKSITIGHNSDWPDEYWIDVTASIWKERIRTEVLAAKKKGFDGIWLDNGDIYWYALEKKKDSLLAKKIYSSMVEMCQWIKGQKMLLIMNGADTFVSKLMDEKRKAVIDGVNQETVFTSIRSYSGDGKFGMQTSAESDYFKTYCIRCKENGLRVFLLEYAGDESMEDTVRGFCIKNRLDGYYISRSIKL